MQAKRVEHSLDFNEYAVENIKAVYPAPGTVPTEN